MILSSIGEPHHESTQFPSLSICPKSYGMIELGFRFTSTTRPGSGGSFGSCQRVSSARSDFPNWISHSRAEKVGIQHPTHPPVAILSISAIYTDVIFAKGFCSFLNCFHFLVSFRIKLFFLSHAPAGKQQIHASKHAHSSQYASIAFFRIRSSASHSAISAIRCVSDGAIHPLNG